MICPPCRKGGALNAAGFADEAAAQHFQCEAPNTCPCHHKTGSGHIVTDERTVAK